MAVPAATALSAQLGTSATGTPTPVGGTPGSLPVANTAPNAIGGPNTNQGTLQDFLTQYQASLNSAQQGITSSVQQGTETLNQAISGLQGQENSFNAAQQGGLQSALSSQANKYGGTLYNAGVAPGSNGMNSVLLKNLAQDNADTIKQLQESAEAAMSNGDVQFATQISNLQAQQYQMALNAKESIYTNLVAEGSSVASLSQAQTAAAAQQETQLNDMATLASKYGVTVQPGDTMSTIINKVAPTASAQEALTLGQMRASITQSNAQAALDAAQASVIAPQSNAQLGSMFEAYIAAPAGSDLQKQYSQELGTMFAANPNNASAYAAISNASLGKTWDLTPGAQGGMSEDMQQVASWISMAQSANLNVGQAVQDYVTNNPYVSAASKGQMAEMFYAGYGTQDAVNPWAEGPSTLSNILSAGLGSADLASKSGSLNSFGQYTAEMNAYSFNRNNPAMADTPGVNRALVVLTGNANITYNEWLNAGGASGSKTPPATK